uniref:Reverse transcriptase domain-containing protein n=1 Tax=Chrysemys picta bellii TaxID=8478 RepID=A0A8C3FSE6_CHRPI
MKGEGGKSLFHFLLGTLCSLPVASGQRASLEKTPRDHLIDTISELGESDLKMFKDKLNNFKPKPGYNRIKWSQLEKAEAVEITRLLVSYYDDDYAVEVAGKVLEDMDKKNLACKLSEAAGKGGAQQTPAPTSSTRTRVTGVAAPMPREHRPVSSRAGDSETVRFGQWKITNGLPGDLPENTILATVDVEALYTNIPQKDGLQAVRNSIPDNVTANLVAELCDFVLNHNYFTFGDNVYLQVSDTAMGTHMTPQHAIIFMADLEQRFLSSRPLTPLLYLRYTDNIFIIWTHRKEALEEFHHDFNNFHPTINLSLDQSTQEIHFLDITVLISNGHINTTLYRKPIDCYTYLHASSVHPNQTTRSEIDLR